MTSVLNIISDTNIGGAGRVLLNYLRYARRDEFKTLVAVPKGSLLVPPLLDAGAGVVEVDGMADRSFQREDVSQLRKVIAHVKPDLVHTHGALSGRIAARKEHVPVVFTRHSVFPVPARLRYPPGRWANKLVNEHYADHIIAVSPAAADNLTSAGISPKKITIVFNGVAPVPPVSPARRKDIRASLGLAENILAFGILARIEEYKGHLYLVEAARKLKDKGRKDFQILIAGTGSFEETVARAVAEQGVGDVVRLLGFRSDVGDLLNALDVQLNASYGTEATSLALLEGMSLGLPSLASDYGGNPWLVRDGDNGFLFPCRDSAALAQHMERLLDDRPLTARMSQRAQEIFQESFTGERFAENVEAVYRRVLKGDRHVG